MNLRSGSAGIRPRVSLMDLSVPFAGYFLMVLIIMFGGRKKRSFTQASQAAAGITVTLLCTGAILWFLSAVISQIVNAGN
jgi:hypothetical protein